MSTTHDRWIRSFIELYLEVEAGLRPCRHIRPLLQVDLQLDIGNGGRLGQRPDIVRIRSQRRGEVCEAVVLLREGDRIGALAISIRRTDLGWRVTEARRPEVPRPALANVPPPGILIQTVWSDREAGQTGPTWRVPPGWTQRDAA
ncbi:MAG: Rv3235 family protein [Euzebya sp.]